MMTALRLLRDYMIKTARRTLQRGSRIHRGAAAAFAGTICGGSRRREHLQWSLVANYAMRRKVISRAWLFSVARKLECKSI